MHEYDEAVLKCFLKNQLQLLPEKVADNIDEAEAFLEECMAVVVDSVDEVWEYFDEEGMDIEAQTKEEILDAAEVFDVGDGRYLIVES
ncbi:MAG: glyoxalase [Lachnospiraceae bacterium]|nr:glyoxalase [Lachnospiraceae bacterium]